MFVTGKPKRFLRVDGLAVLALSIALFSRAGQPWWLFPLALFTPDVTMVGYAFGGRVGALCYNLGHAYALPALVLGLGWLTHRPLALALGAVWFGHVGLDRLLGFGLKYDEGFGLTHLGPLARSRRGDPDDADFLPER